MAQQKILIDGVAYKQPDTFKWSFQTTDDAATTRPYGGVLKGAPLFVVEAYDFVITGLSVAECSAILQKIVRRKGKPNFKLTYLSEFYGKWRTDTFYVAAGDAEIGTIKEGHEFVKSISGRMVGVNPL